jgi:hypothetical protein
MTPATRDAQKAVSPRMIEAGVRAMSVWKDLPTGELVAAVYRAMAVYEPVDRTNPAETSPTIMEILRRYERKP